MPIVKELCEDTNTIVSQIDHRDTHLIDVETEITARYLLLDPTALTRLQGRMDGWKLAKAEYSMSAPFRITATFKRRCTYR